MGEGDLKLQTCGYKGVLGGVMYSLVTVVHTVLYICNLLGRF